MNRIPFTYIWRNLARRRLTTALTAGGMALVVFVFAAVQMLDAGLRATMVATGQPDNVVVIRAGSQTEVNSSIDHEQMGALESLAHVARDGSGQAMFARECVVLYSLVKKDTGMPTNVTIRGTSPAGLTLRPQVALVSGRMFRPGTSEIIVGRALAQRFAGVGLGESLQFARREWQVVGIFDAGKTAFSSEVWGDADQLRQSFRRNLYSAAVFRLDSRASLETTQAMVAADPRMNVELKPETLFYAEQSRALSVFISYLGMAFSAVFSIGAVIGAMITMYAAVAGRTAEIGTLRAIGFTRVNILLAFLAESLLIAILGGGAGLVAASAMQFVTLSTMNWQTFAELAFAFHLTPQIVAGSLLFALGMGAAGGLLPAWRAARINIVEAVRSA